MCGILALLRLLGKNANKYRGLALQMAKSIRHRGPDWSGMYCSGSTILAHERLAIVGTDSGAQPLYSADQKLILCVNGEIYNHRALAKSEDIDESQFMTHSDCEIILHLYRKYQGDATKFLPKLNGMFSFVLYDEERDRFVVARDHVGIVPLYIGVTQAFTIAVASELKALLVRSDEFLMKRVREFPPGSVLCSEDVDISTIISDSKHNKYDLGWKTWYTPKWITKPTALPTRRADLKMLREQFESAVVRQLMSDVPFGVLLSGGLDSSLVASIVAKHARTRVEDDHKTQAWWPRVHTFAIGLKGSPDLAASKKVAKYIDSVHHAFEFTVQDGIDALSDVICHLETFDTTTVRASTPMYLLARRIKAMGIKMVLSGEGSDEIFGGYLYFHKAPDASEFHAETVRKVRDLHLYDCLRANKSMMAWGVEPRVPFLDREFLDYAMEEIDPADKMITSDRPLEKWILREAFEGYLPQEVLWRQKEQFSDGVGYTWIDQLKARAEERVSDAKFEDRYSRWKVNTPTSKEQYWYREIFEEHFTHPDAALTVAKPGPSIACSTASAIKWDKSFASRADPSGRAIAGVHSDAT